MGSSLPSTSSAVASWRPTDVPEGWQILRLDMHYDPYFYNRLGYFEVLARWTPPIPSAGDASHFGVEVDFILGNADEWPYARAQLVALGELLRVHPWMLNVTVDRFLSR